MTGWWRNFLRLVGIGAITSSEARQIVANAPQPEGGPYRMGDFIVAQSKDPAPLALSSALVAAHARRAQAQAKLLKECRRLLNGDVLVRMDVEKAARKWAQEDRDVRLLLEAAGHEEPSE